MLRQTLKTLGLHNYWPLRKSSTVMCIQTASDTHLVVPDQEKDAEVAALQEQLEQLRALEQARGLPSPSTSDTPRVIAAQLQIEQLQRQLQSALQVILLKQQAGEALRSLSGDTKHQVHQARAVQGTASSWLKCLDISLSAR